MIIMRQTHFVLEIALDAQNSPTIILRDPRGTIIRITNNATDITSFLEDVVDALGSSQTPNPISHE